MRERLSLIICIAGGIICTILFLPRLFQTDIAECLSFLKVYGVFLSPMLFIISIFLFLHDRWSVISTLSFICLLVFLINGYLLAYAVVAPSTSLISHENVNGELCLMLIYIADLTVVLLMIAKGIQYHRERRN